MNTVLHRVRIERRNVWFYGQLSSAPVKALPHTVPVIVKRRVH
jgi:hypothetical protein